MLGDLFNDEEEEFETGDSHILPSYKRKGDSCAADLDLPPLPRADCNFVGLSNQGATCYMNSLLQVCYMTPEFRREVFMLPLESIDSGIITGQKFEILSALQQLFANLQGLDQRWIGTEQLTAAFRWEKGEQGHQHDIQELNRVLFDVIDRALMGTPCEGLTSQLYRGKYVHQIICQTCSYCSEREEEFCDMIVPVKGLKGVDESFQEMIQVENLDGSNQYFCESCTSKQDATKGLKVRTFPPILTLSLNRFDFDYETLERKKITSRFEFPLELNVNNYREFSDDDNLKDRDENIYELFGVVIHRGTAHGGHYHCYLRDTLKQGNWYDVSEKLDEEEKKKKESEDETKKNEEVKPTEEKDEKVEDQEQEQETGKKGKKKKNKNKNKNKAKKEDKPHYEPENKYDKVEFPIAFKSDQLAEGWYDFNDNNVTPIPFNRLQKQFGGSNETGYILIYRSKTLSKLYGNEMPDIPVYLQEAIKAQTAANELERQKYEEAKNRIKVILQPQSLFEQIGEHNLYCYKDSKEVESQEVTIETTLSSTVAEFKSLVATTLGSSPSFQDYTLDANKMQLIQVYPWHNGFIKAEKRLIDEEKCLKEAEVRHQTCWMVLQSEEEITPALRDLLLENAGPAEISLRVFGEDIVMWGNQGWPLEKLESIIEERSGLPPNKQRIRILRDGRLVSVRSNSLVTDHEPVSLYDFGIRHKSEVVIELKEEDDEEEELQQANKESIHPENGTSETVPKPDSDDPNDGVNCTILVNDEEDKQEIDQTIVPLKWTIKEVTDFLKKKYGVDIKEVCRLRNMYKNTLYCIEELNTSLKALGFDEGGMRLQLERGEVPNVGLTTIRVSVDPKERVTDVFLKDIETVEELKKAACQAFNLDPAEHKLYTTDWADDPSNPLVKENISIRKAKISDGSLILIKPKGEFTTAELYHLRFFLTKTGHHEDCTEFGTLTVQNSITLRELKEKIIALELFPEQNLSSTKRLRLRERTKLNFFGKIYRGEEFTLKKIGMNPDARIVCQILPEEEDLDVRTLVLLAARRDVEKRDYHEPKEIIFTFSQMPNIADLRSKLAELAPGASPEDIQCAKYFPYLFEWHHLDESVYNQDTANQKRKKKNDPLLNLKKAPILMEDGDLIGYRLKTDHPDIEDDFQREKDKELKKKYEQLKREVQKDIGKGKVSRAEVAVKIYTDF
mmetsp:Transcript_24293/g.27558  ORF Transcript_24293/g.27558 Transcript_24293/m.27558 type:complete len:1186 (-) Transcript_24293:154-3711(-)